MPLPSLVLKLESRRKSLCRRRLLMTLSLTLHVPSHRRQLLFPRRRPAFRVSSSVSPRRTCQYPLAMLLLVPVRFLVHLPRARWVLQALVATLSLVLLHQAALVPRPWDFSPAPAAPVKAIPAEDASKPSDPVDSDEPPTSPHSPSVELPSSRPASPPTLLPPIAIHETSFDEPPVNDSYPVDDTEVEVERKPEASEGEDLPAVAVIPPTPTSINTISSMESVPAV